MKLDQVKRQIDEILSRVIKTSISVKQFSPKICRGSEGSTWVGDLPLSGISLKDMEYDEIYIELEQKEQFHIKLADGGLLLFQYCFDSYDNLVKHRLCYFPSAILPSIDDVPILYEEKDALFADLIKSRLVRFPIRFDFDPTAKKEILHPASHLTLGQFENCRIPVDCAVSPNAFLIFILRNFYGNFFRKNQNAFLKRIVATQPIFAISEMEKKVSHMIISK